MISSSKYKARIFSKKRNDDENQPRVHTWEAWCTVYLFIYWLHRTAWGSNLDPQPWRYGVLTTGPPGDPHGVLFRTRLPTTVSSQFKSIKAVSSCSRKAFDCLTAHSQPVHMRCLAKGESCIPGGWWLIAKRRQHHLVRGWLPTSPWKDCHQRLVMAAASSGSVWIFATLGVLACRMINRLLHSRRWWRPSVPLTWAR